MDGQQFDQAEFRRTMERIREGQDHGSAVIRPDFDPKQEQEHREEAKHGRRSADFIQALERAGFTYWPKGSIPPGCQGGAHLLDPPRPLVEGQWRRPADRELRRPLALTDDQVAAWFTSPEEFWKWIENMKATQQQAQASRGKSQRIFSQVPRNFR